MVHRSKLLVAILTCTVVFFGHAHAQVQPDAGCQTSPESAATEFVRLSIEDARRSTLVLTRSSLAKFRARLEQMLDDRYAPDSSPLRSRLLGTALMPNELSGLSNTDYVGLYLAAGETRRTTMRLIDVQPLSRQPRRYLGEEIVVGYRIAIGESERSQQRTFFASLEGSCWKLEVPLEAWVRLDQLAKILKESRAEPQYTYRQPSTVRLQVAAASDIAIPNSTEYKRPGSNTASVWVSNAALATEKDIASTSAYWDCDAGRDPEHPAVILRLSGGGASKLQDWSVRNLGSLLAVVIEGEVVVYAKVAGTLKDRIAICMERKSLHQATELARALVGAR